MEEGRLMLCLSFSLDVITARAGSDTRRASRPGSDQLPTAEATRWIRLLAAHYARCCDQIKTGQPFDSLGLPCVFRRQMDKDRLRCHKLENQLFFSAGPRRKNV